MNNDLQLTFLGATGTVTGSKTLVEADGGRILVDCGLFQGYKALRLKNWRALPVDPANIDAVVLTHAHLDHSGYLPVLVRSGFRGRVYCTGATRELCAILLPDAGRIAEEDAEYANRKGFSKHHPALPLFTEADAEDSLRYFSDVSFDQEFEPAPGIRATLRQAGHILGAASVLVEAGERRVVFSGDLGRPDDPLMYAPAPPDACDAIVVESTYGDRRHPDVDPEVELGEILRRTIERGGVAVLASFAVGRAQVLLHHIARLKQRGELPESLPVFLNSPMAIDVTALYHEFRDLHRLDDAECERMCHAATLVNSVEHSKTLNFKPGPMVIVAASGMLTGGRVLHHLKAFAPDPKNTILLTGFQAGGTRGAHLAAGAASLRIHGSEVPVRAEVARLRAGSAHADSDQLLEWLKSASRPPSRIFITHGEAAAADALRVRIEHELGWPAEVPEYRDDVVMN